jgi:predicted nucleic acid-binding protein
VATRKRKKRNYVVDSYALLLYFQKQEGWQEIGRLLREWHRERFKGRLNWINWGEIYYMSWKYFGREKALEVKNLIAALPLQLEAIDFELVRAAAELKAENNISYSDAFCAATALRYDAILVTGDPEFKALESRIDIRWV